MLPLKTKASAPAGTVAKTAAPAATAGSADTVRCAGAGTKAMLRRRQMAAAKMQRAVARAMAKREKSVRFKFQDVIKRNSEVSSCVPSSVSICTLKIFEVYILFRCKHHWLKGFEQNHILTCAFSRICTSQKLHRTQLKMGTSTLARSLFLLGDDEVHSFEEEHYSQV